MKKQRRIDQLMEKVTERNQEMEMHYDKVGLYVGYFFGILCGLFIHVFALLIIPAGIQVFRNQVKCGDFWKFWLRTLKTLYSSGTTDKIQDSLSEQVSSTDDASENMELTTDDIDNVEIRTEDE